MCLIYSKCFNNKQLLCFIINYTLVQSYGFMCDDIDTQVDRAKSLKYTLKDK